MEKFEIETERLILNNFKYSDVIDVVLCCRSKKIYKSLLNMPHPYTYDDGMEFIKKSRKNYKNCLGSFRFAIRLKNPEKFVGTISLNYRLSKKTGAIGYWLDPRFWNQGIMTEAARAVVEFAFNELNLHKLVIVAYSTNKGSCRIAEKLGFDLEGCQKELYYHDGEYKDCNNYGLINPKHKHKKRL